MYTNIIRDLYFEISNSKGNIPFELEKFKKDISKEEKNKIDELIKKGSFFLTKTDNNLYQKTYRIEEACYRTLKELKKENFDSYILSLIEQNPLILHNELTKWFDTKHSSMLSYVLDKYWHNFLLYSKEYEEWCFENYNRFLYHSPKFSFENENTTDEEILYDSIKFFNIYLKQNKITENILLYNLPLLLHRNKIKFVEIKAIIEELCIE